MSIILIIAGFVLLVVGGEFLVRSSVSLSFKLNISTMVIGLTVVSFATSLPELLVSLQAALNGASDISLGNVIGSNIANLGLVLGVTAMISAISIDRDFYKFNWPVMLLFSLALYFFLKNDEVLSRVEGLSLLAMVVVYLVVLLRRARKNDEVEVEEVDTNLQKTSWFKIVIWLLIGGAALYFGSDWLVAGSIDLATKLGVSERVISVTMVAVGTSVPELAASVMAAVKKEKALSLGNLIGSNIFNIASVLGITSFILPIKMQSQEVLSTDVWWMLGFALVLLPLVFLPKKFIFSRIKGFFLFAAYSIFIALTVING
ncbi:calcium/sodium antiporter [Haloflavibacter putidus]|uniref:Calcium/sodium antiporter n=1 Tax=Haloflavibacter putidus TaxID=2576776 RepID=A0A507ZVV7_9FLAO|nr:calcium/sodium antiporter [Haloflavibacter putidus]TQD38905.1 calcium/sodium antiporter [Haloflavibacter putidus]